MATPFDADFRLRRRIRGVLNCFGCPIPSSRRTSGRRRTLRLPPAHDASQGHRPGERARREPCPGWCIEETACRARLTRSAAADGVDGDHEIAIRVEGLAGPDVRAGPDLEAARGGDQDGWPTRPTSLDPVGAAGLRLDGGLARTRAPGTQARRASSIWRSLVR